MLHISGADLEKGYQYSEKIMLQPIR